MDNTKKWLSQQVNKLRKKNVSLTYELMEILESSSSKDKTTEKKNRLKVENKQFKDYIQHLVKPLQQEDETFVPPAILPRESVERIEEIRVIAQTNKEWIEGAHDKVNVFIRDFVQAYESYMIPMQNSQHNGIVGGFPRCLRQDNSPSTCVEGDS